MVSSSNVFAVYVIGSLEVLAAIQLQWQTRQLVIRKKSESQSLMIMIIMVVNLKLIRNK